MPPKKASSSTVKSANMMLEDPDEPRVVLEEVAPEVEQLRETMGVFQEEMAQFNAHQESFAQVIAKQMAELEWQRQEMEAKNEEIKKHQEEADQRHCEAALALEAATQSAQVNARAAAAAIPAQEMPKDTAEPRSQPGKTGS